MLERYLLLRAYFRAVEKDCYVMSIKSVIRYIKNLVKTKSGIFSMLGANVLNKSVSMLSAMLITRLLSTRDYGIWSYTLNFYLYLSMVTGLGLLSGAMQFGTENKGEGKAYAYFKYCIDKGLIVDLILISLAALLALSTSLPIQGSKTYILCILPFLLIEYIFSIMQAVLRSQNRITQYARMLNFNSVSLTLGTCSGALVGVGGVLIGRYIAELSSVIFAFAYLKNDAIRTLKASKLEKHEKNQLWKYSLFTGASSAMNTVVYLIDVSLIAELIKDSTEVAIYKVGTLIPNALSFIPSSIIVAVLPNIIYHRQDIKWVRKNLKKVYCGLLLCNLAICSFSILFAPVIIAVTSGSKYKASIPIFRILVLGYLLSGTFRSLSTNVLASFRRVKFGLFISITSCISDVAFNIVFILRYGAIGAAYATLLVDLVSAFLSFGYVIYLLKRGTINEECN